MKLIKKLIFIIIALVVVLFLIKDTVLKKIYPLNHEKTIEQMSINYNMDKYFVMGIISTESNFKADAKSHKNAKGLMQIKEETAIWCIEKFNIDATKDNYTVPEKNIEIGCAYIDYLIKYFNGNKKTALAAYNAGIGRVEEWLKNGEYSKDGKTLYKIPFEETAKYVKKVEMREKIYRYIYSK